MRERAIRIFEYLRELKKLSCTVTWDIASYGFDPIWIHDIPAAAGVKSNLTESAEDSGIWLEVRKQKLPVVPPPPAACKGWVRDGKYDDHRSEPELATQRETPDDGGTFPALHDNPQVTAEFGAYLAEQWRPWASQYAQKLPAYLLYNRLFEMHSTIKKEGEKVELVLGMGLLVWKLDSQHLRRHLFASSVQLEFDPYNGVISLRPAIDGPDTRFECEVLQDVLQRDQIAHVSSMLDAISDVCDRTEVDPLLSYATNLLPNSTFNPSASYQLLLSDKPVVAWAPAFFLRKRGEFAWLRAYESIINALKGESRVPANIQALTNAALNTDLADSPDAASAVSPSASGDDRTLYFPHPSNEAQRRIVDRIRRSRGVLVQGPPGTGKSHTIANLICHFLALGKKILITSQTPRALKVLRDKIPPSYQGLCVSVLGNDPDSLRNLNDAVQAFNERYANKPDNASEEREIARLGAELDDVRGKAAQVSRQLLDVAESQCRTYAYGPYTGTLMDLSKAVATDVRRFAWIPSFAYAQCEAMPDAGQVGAFVEATRVMTAQRVSELSRTLPGLDQFPDDATFLSRAQQYSESKRAITASAALLADEHFALVRRASKEQLDKAYAVMRDLESRLVVMRHDAATPWVTKFKADLLVESVTKWQTVLQEGDAAVSGLRGEQHLDEVLKRVVKHEEGLDTLSLLAAARCVLQHCAASGRPRFAWRVFTDEGRSALRALRGVRVDGQPVEREQTVQQLVKYLDVVKRIDEARRVWDEYGLRLPDQPWAALNELTAAQVKLGTYLEVAGHIAAARACLAAIEPSLVPRWDDEAAIDRTQELILLGTQNIVLDECDSWFYRHKHAIQAVIDAGNAHTHCQLLLQAFEDKSPGVYRKALSECRAVRAEQEKQEWWRTLYAGLTGNKKLFYEHIRSHIHEPAIDAQLLEWQTAWHYAEASAFVDHMLSTDTHAKLYAEHGRLAKREAELLCEVGSRMAWHKCLQAMRTEEIQYLRAWAQAVKRIGKGTGKWVNKHRRDAQEALNKCRSAIPAWVMPLYRVVENVRIEPEAFDVVIIDEASQSGPDALILEFLGKQCVVVGDSEQIAPESFADREKVYRLIDEYLYDIPHKERYDPETSLYSHAEIRFPETVLLNEHFRCMPEIIQFSNDAFYHGRLECLTQYPPHRLQPVVTRHVDGGFRDDGRKANKHEAAALVSEVVQCCHDPRYAGMSMGVVSLVGADQAKLIEASLRRELDPQEIETRNIICGDAYSFQGDERDVMFLSMVADPNTGTILTKASDGRRINVAASRARQQMVLFHSFMPQDMGAASYLRRLLAYCLQPKRTIDDGDAEEMRGLFQSPFEEDVFNILTDKGYFVQPQFKCAGRRIDLVVSGMQGRLAIECDGDRWHGPEKLEEDMERQRLLERCGWAFWRVRGGEFYRDRELAMEPLWQMLRDRGIEARTTQETEQADLPAQSIAPKPVIGVRASQPVAVDTPQRGDTAGASTNGRLGAALAYSAAKRQPELALGQQPLIEAILAAMRGCTDHTCAKESLVTLVCRQLGIVKRAGPRRVFAAHVMVALAALLREGTVQECGPAAERVQLAAKEAQGNMFA